MSEYVIDGNVQMGPFGPSGETLAARIDRDLAKLLNHLLRLGHDLMGAYEAAIGHIEDDALKIELRLLEGAHGRQMRELGGAVETLAGQPASHRDVRALVEQGRVYVAALAGDEAVLNAMAKNEAALADAYRAAQGHAGLPEDIRAIIARAITDESKHRAFYDELLRRFVG